MKDIRLCPKCGSDSYVIETRTVGDGSGEIRRRRVCSKCGYRYSTREILYDYRQTELDRINQRLKNDPKYQRS